MPEQPPTDPSGDRPVQARLEELARFLRQSRKLDQGARQALADLVAELSQDLKPDTMNPQEKAHLADTVARLTQALQQGRGLRSIKADAAFAAGFLQRLLDALSNIGI
jgi:hypothetical protein